MPVRQERVFDGRWAGSQCREERPRASLQSTTLVCTPSPHVAEHWRWRNILKILQRVKVHFSLTKNSEYIIFPTPFSLKVRTVNYLTFSKFKLCSIITYLRPDAVVPARAVVGVAGLPMRGSGRGAVVVGDADHRGVARLGTVHLAELVSRAARHGAGAPLARLPADEGEKCAGEMGV